MGDWWEAELSGEAVRGQTWRWGAGREPGWLRAPGKGRVNLHESPGAWRLSRASAALGAARPSREGQVEVGPSLCGSLRGSACPCAQTRLSSGCRRRRVPRQFLQFPHNCLLSVPLQFLDLISSSGRRDPKSVQQPILLKEG